MWKKGESGNPSGRPKIMRELTVLARTYTTDAINGLVKIGRSSKSDAARATAWNSLLDRGWGRPPQFATGDADEFRRAMDVSDDELATIAHLATGSGNGTVTPEKGPSKLN